MDEQTATHLAAAQMIDSLGPPAGFMIALRLIQVIAERTTPKTPELIDAFASCLKGMERFAQVAALDQMADGPQQQDGAASPLITTVTPASAEAPEGVGRSKSNGKSGNGGSLA